MKVASLFQRWSGVNSHWLKRYVFWITIDLLVVIVCLALAWSVRALTVPLLLDRALTFLLVAVVTYCLVNFLFGIYHRIWLYASASEIVVIAAATAVSTVLLALMVLLWPGSRPVPLSVQLLTGLLVFVGFVSVRYRKRVWTGFLWRWRALQGQFPPRQRVLIVGAGEAGQLLAWRFIHQKEGEQYEVVGFVDDNPEKHGLRIHGFKVLGDRYAIPDIVKQHQVDLIVLAMYNIAPQEFEAILDICEQTPAMIKVLPNIFDFLSSKQHVLPIRSVTAEDLIGREPVRIDTEACSALLKDKVVLVTGAAGSIGSELCRQILTFKPALLLAVDNNESGLHDLVTMCYTGYRTRGQPQTAELQEDIRPLVADITRRDKVDVIFRRYRPHVVFHAAAYKHVPLMEEHPDEAVWLNVHGTRVVAEAALRYGVERFVFISTDKAVNPRSVMGATKRLGELILMHRVFPLPLQDAPTRFTAVRFGNVLGSRGSVVPLFERQIDAGGPVTVTHPDMSRYFMSVSEAVSLVIQAAALTQGRDIFMLDMGRRVRIDDLARRLIRLRGLRPDIDIPIVYTGPRPGEKLHEELIGDNEERKPTEHPRIWRIVSTKETPCPSLAQIDLLIQLARDQQIEPMLELLWQLVTPQFQRIRPNTNI